MTDASNHRDTKIFPVLLTYLKSSKGIQVTVLELNSMPGERVEAISEFFNELSEQPKHKR
jgi:hypothetical protein